MKSLVVFITVGDGVQLGTDGERLIIESSKTGPRIDLGPMTEWRIDEIQGYLDRMKAHTR